MDEPHENIIACTKIILKEGGYSEFSMHKVAAASNLDLPTLKSHFKSKSSLLTALATSYLESNCAYFNRCQIEQSGSIQQDLNLWLLNLLRYRESEACEILFKEFWAIALHEQEMRLVLDQYYRQVQHIILKQLQAIAPENCTAQRLDSASCFLLPFIEGYSLMRPTLPVSLLQLSELLSKSLLTILLEE